jgi:hypothetical protein
MALGNSMWLTMLRDECATALLAAVVTRQMASEAYVQRTSAYATNQQTTAMRKDVLDKQGELLAYVRAKYGAAGPVSRGSRMLPGESRWPMYG